MPTNYNNTILVRKKKLMNTVAIAHDYDLKYLMNIITIMTTQEEGCSQIYPIAG